MRKRSGLLAVGLDLSPDLLFPGLFQLYGYDLESEFSQFQDWLKSFPLCKGRANAEDFEEDEEERFMGKYKVLRAELGVYLSWNILGVILFHAFSFPPQGSFLVYPIDEEDIEDTTCQITKGIPKNSAIKALVRAYIIKVTRSFKMADLYRAVTWRIGHLH